MISPSVLDGHTSIDASGSVVAPKGPTNFVVQGGPENVANFTRQGNDLIINMKSGDSITIQGFAENGVSQNNLVFAQGGNNTLVDLSNAFAATTQGVLDPGLIAVEGIGGSISATSLLGILSTSAAAAGVVNGMAFPNDPADPVEQDAPAPTESLTIESALDNEGARQSLLPNHAVTDDTTPLLSGSLGQALAEGESVQVLRDGEVIGTASVSITGWIYEDSGLQDGNTYEYSARIVDSTGNVGAQSSTFEIGIDTSAPTQTASITKATDDRGLLTGALSDGDATDDTTPLLLGTLSAELGAGETVQVLRDGDVIGTARVDGIAWTFADSGLQDGNTYEYSARLVDAAGNTGTVSDGFSISVDTTAPTRTASISAVTDDQGSQTGPVSDSGATDDTSPLLSGTLSEALGVGETVQVLRDGAVIGTANVGATDWSYADSGLESGDSYQYTVRVVDAVGNAGTTSTGFSIEVDIDAPTLTAAIVAATDDQGSETGTLANGATTDDTTPLLSGTLSDALGLGDTMQVLRDGEVIGTASVGSTNWSYADSGLESGNSYQYTVRVVDAVGNEGASSSPFDINIGVDATTLTTTARISYVHDDAGAETGNLVSASIAGEAAPDPVVAAYFPEWGIYGRDYMVNDVPVESLTQLIYAFAKIDEDGKMAIIDPYAALEKSFTAEESIDGVADVWGQGLAGNFNQLAKLKDANPELSITMAVGGWSNSGNFSDMAASAETRATFVGSVVDFLRTYPMFDGVDFDWEFPGGGGLDTNAVRDTDGQNYALLLSDLRGALDALEIETGREYDISIAAPVASERIADMNLEGLSPYVDYFHVMAYDFNGRWSSTTGHQAPMYDTIGGSNDVTTAIQMYLAAGVDASKIILGAPTYDYGWTGVPNGGDGGWNDTSTGLADTRWEDGVFDYKELYALVQDPDSGWTIYWDDNAQAAYAYNADDGIYSTLETPASVAMKAEWAQSLGLGGMMFWDITGDTLVADSLIKAAYESFLTGKSVADIIAESSIEPDVIIGGDGVIDGYIGSTTDDDAPTLAGTLSTTLLAGQTLQVLRNGAVIGTASVSGTNWTYADSGLEDGHAYSYTVRVVDQNGQHGPISTAFEISVDSTVAPLSSFMLASVDLDTGNEQESPVVLGDAQGFIIQDDAGGEESDLAVTAAGDVNGDGTADFIVRAPGGEYSSDQTYVIYGSATGGSAVDLSSLAATQGFLIPYDSADGQAAPSVVAANDLNRDGYDDLIVVMSDDAVGSGTVVFGSDDPTSITTEAAALGTSGADVIADADSLSAVDKIKILLGFEGDDTFNVGEMHDVLIDGGEGFDKIILSGSDIDIDLSSASNVITSVEALDITGSGDNRLAFTADDLLRMSSSTNTLVVDGDAGDTVQAIGFADTGSEQEEGGTTYDVYSNGTATLWLDKEITNVVLT
ncbi:MAG: glycosyl hydrolase family 18 protein [Rhizobiaceae bacterium]|nr:glycosyl hydrolase family 18 protein [Rhizobiaceae bacterium]